MREFLAAVRHLIAELGIDGVALPTASEVRHCLAGTPPRRVVAIDFDFGDFILPLFLSEWLFALLKGGHLADIAADTALLVQAAAFARQRIARREHAIRRALEDTVEKIGSDVAALWLRMDPFPVGESPALLPRQAYAWCMITLGEALKWEPIGSDRVRTITSIRNHAGYIRATQRRRASMLAELNRSGSIGHVCEVAKALIDEHGLDPTQVVEQAIEARRLSRRGCIEFDRNGRSETLRMLDGVLQAFIHLGEGFYDTGRISVFGQVPETLVIAPKGRPVADLIDHPGLRASGIKVSKAANLLSSFELQHRGRTIAVEQLAAARNDGHLPTKADSPQLYTDVRRLLPRPEPR